jgi:toxin ParE1/3/4
MSNLDTNCYGAISAKAALKEIIMGMNVNLTPQLEANVQEKISSGLYASVKRSSARSAAPGGRKRRPSFGQVEPTQRRHSRGSWERCQRAFECWGRQEPRPREAHSEGITEGPRVTRRPLAASNIAGIGEFIADDSFNEADAWVDRLESTLKLLATQPKPCRRRNELAASLWSFPFGRYVIFYVALVDEVEVVRLLHSAREVGSEFTGDDAPLGDRRDAVRAELKLFVEPNVSVSYLLRVLVVEAEDVTTATWPSSLHFLTCKLGF